MTCHYSHNWRGSGGFRYLNLPFSFTSFFCTAPLQLFLYRAMNLAVVKKLGCGFTYTFFSHAELSFSLLIQSLSACLHLNVLRSLCVCVCLWMSKYCVCLRLHVLHLDVNSPCLLGQRPCIVMSVCM